MAFFIETMLGGLMTGMLYSLVALGFVLIFKASGVFNFAQGAMVLVAALAMARFSEWSNAALGGDSLFLANVIGIIGAGTDSRQQVRASGFARPGIPCSAPIRRVIQECTSPGIAGEHDRKTDLSFVRHWRQ